MADKIPSLNWLRVFEAAARCESFARAAAELNMSAAGVSQQVRALEERLGAALFERHAHAVSLTETGRAYLPGVQQALLTLQNATDGLFGTERAQHLFVQSILLFAHGILTPGYAGFTAAHPQISLRLTTGNTPFDFAHGFSDMQIIFGSPLAYGAEGDRLLEERLYPVARADLAATISTPQDLMQHQLVEVSSHRAGWPHVFDGLGILPVSARYVFVDNTPMAYALASEGVGIALARAPASDKAMSEAGLVPCLPGASVAGREAYHLVYAERDALRAPARLFREWLLDWCSGLR